MVMAVLGPCAGLAFKIAMTHKQKIKQQQADRNMQIATFSGSLEMLQSNSTSLAASATQVRMWLYSFFRSSLLFLAITPFLFIFLAPE